MVFKDYFSPQIKVVEINAQSVLCQSSGSDADTGSVTINGYTEDELDW